jgi:hypothetical protein
MAAAAADNNKGDYDVATTTYFTRDFVGDFDILLMLKVGLKEDGESQRQQREGGGGGGNRGEGLWQQE